MNYSIHELQEVKPAYQLRRGRVPGEVVHSRGDQIMLIVLRKLLKLVLMRKPGIYAEIPEEGQVCDKSCIMTHARQCDRWIGAEINWWDNFSSLQDSLVSDRLTSRCLLPSTVAVEILVGGHGAEGSIHSLIAVCGSEEPDPVFFWNWMVLGFIFPCLCISICVYCSWVTTWSAGGSCGAAPPGAAAGWGIAGARPEVGMRATRATSWNWGGASRAVRWCVGDRWAARPVCGGWLAVPRENSDVMGACGAPRWKCRQEVAWLCWCLLKCTPTENQG